MHFERGNSPGGLRYWDQVLGLRGSRLILPRRISFGSYFAAVPVFAERNGLIWINFNWTIAQHNSWQ